MASLTLTTFQNADGSPVENGYLLIWLNQACVSGTNQLGVQKVKVPLIGSGEVEGSPSFFASDTLEPTSAYYVQSVYSANGQLVAGPFQITVTDSGGDGGDGGGGSGGVGIG